MKHREIVASLARVELPAGRREALLGEILARADAEREAPRQGEENPMHRVNQNLRSQDAAARGRGAKRMRPRRTLRYLVPAAILLAVLAVILAVPGVSKAIGDWFYDIFRADRYLYVPAGERAHDPDLDGAIVPQAELEQTNQILLLSETEEYEERNASRIENGFPAYDPEDWAFLKDMRPAITDLYYDGVDFMVMTFFPCDPRPFMSGYIDSSLSDMRLDILSLDAAVITNLGTNEAQDLYPTGFGLIPQKDYRNADGSANVEAILADGGVWLYTEYELPYQEQLAPGRYRVSVRHRVLDGRVGEMSAGGTVAVLDQTFVLDTSKALAAIRETVLPEVRFSGAYAFTLERWDDQGVEYRTERLDLSGLTLTPTVQERPTGVRVFLAYAYPADWDEETVRGGRGLLYELFVDGESKGMTFIGGDGEKLWIDIPITESERETCRSLLLRPVVERMTEIVMDDGTSHPVAGGYKVSHATGYEPVTESEPVPGCDIVIPLD